MSIEQDRYREYVREELEKEGLDPAKVTVAFDDDLGEHWPKGAYPPGAHFAEKNVVYTVDYVPGSGPIYSALLRTEGSAYTREMAQGQVRSIASGLTYARVDAGEIPRPDWMGDA